MDLNFDGKKYRISFTYQSETGDTGPKARLPHCKQITTFANVLIRDENDERKWVGIAGSFSKNDSRDEWEKAKGRKIALQWAVRQLPSKALRRVIWDEYFNTHRDGQLILS